MCFNLFRPKFSYSKWPQEGVEKSMNINYKQVVGILLTASAISTTSVAQAVSEDRDSRAAKRDAVIAHWTKDRRDAAIPRDLLIDPRGLGYLRKPDGSLEPYGHQVAAEATRQSVTPLGKPSGSGDTTGPTIDNMIPAAPLDGDPPVTIGSSQEFSATVSDPSGVKSVDFVIIYPDGVTEQTFRPSAESNDTWSIILQGFSDGNWSWRVEAKDNGDKGGNTAVSDPVPFIVDTAGGGGDSGGGDNTGSGGTVTNAAWSNGGDVQTAAGRIYFEMPSNAKRKGPWNGYVCSGSVVEDGTSGRSLILTAGHCVYDDANKAFARNVLFIPNQDGTTGNGTDLNCNNDPLGCWTPSFGVVDQNWTTRTFPDNIPWDYAFYVVSDNGAHSGTEASSDILDQTVGALPISFEPPAVDVTSSADFTHALGYSYSDDPNFMYCAEDMMSEEAYFDWWLPSCGLSGGASGGPWVQPMDTGTGSGPVISVNSWGYTNSPGMAGPKLVDTSAECIYFSAKTESFDLGSDYDGDAGYAIAYDSAKCPPPL